MKALCRYGRGAATIMTVTALGILISGCGILDVTNPQAIDESDLNDPSLEREIANGAAATFADGYHTILHASELAADVVIWTGSETANNSLDNGIWRDSNTGIDLSYATMSSARWTADDAVRRLNEILADPQSNANVARSQLFAGFSLLVLGDHFSEFTMDGGPPRSAAEAYEEADARLESAFQTAQAAGATELAAAALGGQARAHHALAVVRDDAAEYDQAAQLASDALALSPDFEFLVAYGRPARANEWWGNQQNELESGIGQGWRRDTDPVTGGDDPRIAVSDFVGIGPNGEDSVFFQEKFPTAENDIPLVTWQEMKLIIAEAEWRNDQLGAAVSAINDVRTAAGLPSFSSNDSQEVRDQLIYERAAEFFLEGRRWFDGRRFSDEFGDVDILPDPRWLPEAQLEPVTRKWGIPQSEANSNPNV